MSDTRRLRTVAGVALLAGAALLLFLPLLPQASPAVRYRAAENRNWILRETATAEPGPGETVSVNHADAEELQALPGIGSVYADRIVGERRENGPFFYPEDLETVNGIGPRTVEEIRDRIRTGDE